MTDVREQFAEPLGRELAGDEIEQVAESNPAAIQYQHVDPLLGLPDHAARRLAFAIGVGGFHCGRVCRTRPAAARRPPRLSARRMQPKLRRRRDESPMNKKTLGILGALALAFNLVIGVSGIGPKLAITALSGLTSEDLRTAIRNGAVEQLVRIPGVGKKTAERLLLELKGKLGADVGAVSAAGLTPAHTDIIQASALAFVNALNKLEQRRVHYQPAAGEEGP